MGALKTVLAKSMAAVVLQWVGAGIAGRVHIASLLSQWLCLSLGTTATHKLETSSVSCKGVYYATQPAVLPELVVGSPHKCPK